MSQVLSGVQHVNTEILRGHIYCPPFINVYAKSKLILIYRYHVVVACSRTHTNMNFASIEC